MKNLVCYKTFFISDEFHFRFKNKIIEHEMIENIYNKSNLTWAELFPNQLLDMRGKTIKGTTFDFPPFIFEHKSNGSIISYSGIEINILNALAQSLNFTYSLARPTDGLLWGGYHSNNKVMTN